MKDKDIFKNIVDSYPSLSSYICFAKLVRGRMWKRDKINRLMNSLVDRGDYESSQKQKLLTLLTQYSNEKN